MAFKVFLDANVLLDLTLQREKYSIAEQLVKLAIDGKIQAFITPSIVHIIGYWTSKQYGPEKTKAIILNLLVNIQVIDISHDSTITALHSKINDIEDALQYYAALSHKLDCFLTYDKKLINKAIPNLPIYSPVDFLANYEY